MTPASAGGSQALGGAARSFSFDQVSVNRLDHIEVNYPTGADQDADAPAGTINLTTKRGFERKGPPPLVAGQRHGQRRPLRMAPQLRPARCAHPQVPPRRHPRVFPSFFRNRLGLVFNLNESSPYVVQSRVDHTDNAATTPTDPRPRVLTNVTAITNPRFTASLGLSLGAMYNSFDAFIDNRTAAFSAPGRRASVTGDGLNNFTFNNAQVALSTNHEHQYAQTRTVTPGFAFRRGASLVDGGLHCTISTNQYVALPRVGPQTLTTAALTGLTLQLRRAALNDVDWPITQTAGRDLSDLANFTNPRLADDARFAEPQVWRGHANVRWDAPWRLPTGLKFGAKATEDYHRFRNPNAALTWRYDGPGGGPTGAATSTTGVTSRKRASAASAECSSRAACAGRKTKSRSAHSSGAAPRPCAPRASPSRQPLAEPPPSRASATS